MMTDDDMFELIQHHVDAPSIDAGFFKGHPAEVASFIMGVSSVNPYVDFDGPLRPWTRALQIGRLMNLFYDAPSPVSVAMALYIVDQSMAEPIHVRNNLIKGIGFTMSDYTYRIFKAAQEGIECHTTRTYHILKHIQQLAVTRRILLTPNMGMDLEYIQYQIGSANTALIPICNEAVDAHPVAREMLRRFIEEVQRLIQPGVKDAA